MDNRTDSIKRISCIDPIYSAWDKMEKTLFAPFKLSKWLTLGFTAWLANLGGGIGGGFNFPDFSRTFDGARRHGHGGGPESAADCIRYIKSIDWNTIIGKITSSALVSFLIGLGIIAIITVIVLMIIMMWVKARGEFMFLDNLVNNRTEISSPWKKFKKAGNSLFLWRFCFGIFIFAGMFFSAGTAFLMCLSSIRAEKLQTLGIAGICLGVFLLLCLALIAWIIEFLVRSFVVQIMFKRQIGAVSAFLEVCLLFSGNLLNLVKFATMSLVLSMSAVIVIVMLLIFTCCLCCIGVIILSLPYLWAVSMLPILTFFRFYSVDFFAQFGPEYSVYQV